MSNIELTDKEVKSIKELCLNCHHHGFIVNYKEPSNLTCDIFDDFGVAWRDCLGFNFDHVRNWREDYNKENGNYENTCGCCEQKFIGNKHRRCCKLCGEDE